MKRYIQSLVLLFVTLMLACGAASADGRARVSLGGRELIASPPAVESEGEVYLPLSVLGSLGASYAVPANSDTAAVTGTSGQSTDVPGRRFDGVLMLPAGRLAQALNASAEWDAPNRTLKMSAKISSVEFADGELRINSTLPVACSTSEWKDAAKVIVDIPGAKLATDAKEVLVGSGAVQRVRLGQPSEDVARIVLDLSSRMPFRRTSKPIDSKIVLKLGNSAPATTPSAPSNSTVPATPTTPGAPAEPAQPSAPAGALTGIKVDPESDTSVIVHLITSGKVASQTSLQFEPLCLNVDLLNAALQMPAEEIPVNHPLVRSIQIQNDAGVYRVRVILNTTRFVAYDVQNQDGDISVSIRLPKSAGGKLSEKTIVIDPGHGGRQTGTRNGGLLEKDVNLQIGKRVHRILVDEGVNAVLTRDGDHGLLPNLVDDLRARPGVAAKVHADLFVSLHCNSGNSSSCGTETYYHGSAPSSRALAQAIQASVVREVGMKDRRARSDTTLYSQGLAVLRYATVPAVLVESGYLSNSGDRSRLSDPDWQEKIARAIVDGIKTYVEGAQ